MLYRTAVTPYDQRMQPLVIEYLQKHSFAELEEEHGVCARPSMSLDKFSLNYDQIHTKNGDRLSEQCRGLVVRPKAWKAWKALFEHDITWLLHAGVLAKDAPWRRTTFMSGFDVLAWPMNRFYNLGDSSAASVDWSDTGLRVYEKVDGTCIILYWDPEQCRWHAATRGVPEADLPIYKGHLEIGDTTYSQLFMKALVATREATSGSKVDWDVDGYDKAVHLNKELTYVFELVSPWNQMVVSYTEPRAYLLAARHTATGNEVPIESLRLEHVLRPRTWPISDGVSLAAFVDSADPSKLEGAVACDSAFRRVKVKNKGWVLASRSKDTVTASPRSALECIIAGKADDVVALVPVDVGDRLLRMQWAYSRYCRSLDASFVAFKAESCGLRKEFAKRVMSSGDWPAPYFGLWEHAASDAAAWFESALARGKLSPAALDAILSRLPR